MHFVKSIVQIQEIHCMNVEDEYFFCLTDIYEIYYFYKIKNCNIV